MTWWLDLVVVGANRKTGQTFSSNLCSKLLCVDFFLTQVGFVQLLAPSQTGSSISVWSVYRPARWQKRRWESAEFPLRGTGGGRVLVSHPSTDRPRQQEIHSSDSTICHLEGKHKDAYTKTSQLHSHIPSWGVQCSYGINHTPPPTWLSVHRHNKTITTGHQMSHLWKYNR